MLYKNNVVLVKKSSTIYIQLVRAESAIFVRKKLRQ